MRRVLFLIAALTPAVAYADPITIGGWVATAFLAAAPSAGLVTAAVVGWVTAGVVTVAISSGLAALSRQLAPSPKSLRSISQEYGGTVEARRIIYGETRVSGMNVIPPVVSGDEGDYLHQVLVISGHEVNDIGTVYFNQDAITDGMIGAISGAAADGLVSSGTYEDIAWIRRYDGTQTTVDYILDQALYTNWESTAVGHGLAYLALQYKFKKNPYAKTGKPESSCIVQGKKVYDPRLDSTNGGSGTHRYTDASTWEYSNNPALCLADYLMDENLGLGEDPERIDWTTVAVAANECDEVVAIPTGTTPASTTQYRYRCNLVLDATAGYEENIEALCDAMLGHCYYSSGKWQIYAGAWSSSAFDLTEADIVGGVSVKTEVPRKDKFNAVRGQYFDPNRQYLPSEFQPVTNSSYETEDGERIWREIQLRGVTNEYEAQRIAIILNRRGRNAVMVTADFNISAFKVRPYETGTMTLPEIGWDQQPVRCASWEFRPEGTVRLTLVEESSTDWSDPAYTDYTFVEGAAAPTSADYTPPAVTSLTATPVTNGVLLEWTSPEVAPGTYFEVIRETTSTIGSPPTLLATTYGTSYIDPTTGGSTYYFWVRPVSSAGTQGSVYPAGAGVSGAGTVVTDGADGADGADGVTPIVSELTNAAHVVAALSDGTGYSLTGAGGTHKVTEGITDRTTSATHSVVGGTTSKTQNGLTITVGASTGVYTLSGASWTSDTETFTLRAVYGGVTMDKVYTISKAKAGAAGAGNTSFYFTAGNVTRSTSGASPSATVTTNTYPTFTYYNGTSPYTYKWTHLETSSGNTPTISDSTSATPTWSATVITEVDSVSFWRVIVTDSSGTEQVADDVIRVRLSYLQV